jgi:DNA-binding response OmpR family regulator
VQSPLKDGRGSKVYFTLPTLGVSDLPPKEAAPPASARPTRPSHTVVLLTEQVEASAGLREYLEGRGFEIHAYQVDRDSDWMAGTVALQPAAVVIEDALAARQSWEIIGLLKRQTVTANVPVLVYTLNAEQNQGELLELNYLVKPLRLEQLTDELKRHGLGGQHTLLVVDDDPHILTVHSRMIQQAGYRVLQAHHGREALAVINQTRPDLILLDLLMPEMDGFEVLNHLRRQEATRNIPVIVVTGQTLAEDDMERLNRGVASILNKGLFSADETLGRIEAALARQSGLSSTAQRFVRRALAFMQAHFAEPISREDIARHIAISGNYLTDCFRQVLGITPMTYLTRYRIQRAQQLLDTTDLTITDIALETGFSEISHFTRTFKREVGLSPHVYRRGQRPTPASPL